MKTHFTLVVFLFCFISVNAQNKVGISFSQNLSTFRFVDSEGNKDDLDYAMRFGYGLSFHSVFDNQIFVEGQLLYNVKGANSELNQEKLDWSFHYVNIGVNAGYKFTIDRLYPHVGAGLYYGRLLKADQFIGSVYYDLMALDNTQKNDFGVNVFGGLEYAYSKYGSVFLRINESIGLLQLEENTDEGQKMYNRTISVQLGLFFNIE